MNIYEKIIEVMKAVGYLQKDGQIKFGSVKYKFLSEEKITTVVREEMIKQKLIMYPTEIINLESEEFYDDIIVNFTIVDAEKPEDSITVSSKGCGMDRGDKKTYKALTGAFKYAQRQTFMIPTGDDPDHQSSEEGLKKIESSKKSEKKSKPENKSDFIANIEELIPKVPPPEFVKICKRFDPKNGDWKNITDRKIQIEFYREILEIIRIFKEQEKNGSEKPKSNDGLPF